ncbi:hypothetical protein [Methylobacterium gregans]|uniref:hypothetical protein n=1 Tax=Methylobacterium gregans TaxID=374424 RepID=UPI001EE3587F|nr:hypothetical protein [Methylobacterium gregans]MDQ0522118.1 hypothetical protein [Methylobacterium gregans]
MATAANDDLAVAYPMGDRVGIGRHDDPARASSLGRLSRERMVRQELNHGLDALLHAARALWVMWSRIRSS